MSDMPIQKKTSDASKQKGDVSPVKNRDTWHDIAPRGSTSNPHPHIGNNLPDMDKSLFSPALGHHHHSKRKHLIHQNLAEASESLTNQEGFSSLHEHKSLT